MVYGVFDKDGNHIYTYEYGDVKIVAEKMARSIGNGFYARELTSEEYWDRMKEIYQINKH